MKKKTYTDKNGEVRTIYAFEDGDLVEVDFVKVYDKIKNGETYKTGYVKTKDGKIVGLTSGQAKSLNKVFVREGDYIQAYSYDTERGTFVGLRVVNKKKDKEEKKSQLPPLEEPREKEDKIPNLLERYLLGNLVYDDKFLPWVKYADESIENFVEVLNGLADYLKADIHFDLNTQNERINKLYKAYKEMKEE